MNGWKIQRINTATGQVTLQSEGGDSVDIVIPHEHRAHPRSHQFIQEHCATLALTVAAAPIAARRPSSARIWLVAAALLVLAILHRKGIL